MVAQETGLTAERVVDELKRCGVTHMVCLADTKTSFIYEAMMSQKEITLVPFCREGEGVAIAAYREGKSEVRSLQSYHADIV